METLTLALERLATPLGQMLVATDGQQRLRALDWHDFEARMHLLLRRHYPRTAVQWRQEPLPVPSPAARGLRDYFDGQLSAIDGLEVATGGTDFQRQVWAALRTIPAGQSTSYRELAGRLGRERAVRAVGAANGANPVGIVIPCHRLLGSDQSLTGYAGGLWRKQWLLAHEQLPGAG
jgi:methylated-DNA-[protein]-cysteine S-methyltransferase